MGDTFTWLAVDSADRVVVGYAEADGARPAGATYLADLGSDAARRLQRAVGIADASGTVRAIRWTHNLGEPSARYWREGGLGELRAADLAPDLAAIVRSLRLDVDAAAVDEVDLTDLVGEAELDNYTSAEAAPDVRADWDPARWREPALSDACRAASNGVLMVFFLAEAAAAGQARSLDGVPAGAPPLPVPGWSDTWTTHLAPAYEARGDEVLTALVDELPNHGRQLHGAARVYDLVCRPDDGDGHGFRMAPAGIVADLAAVGGATSDAGWAAYVACLRRVLQRHAGDADVTEVDAWLARWPTDPPWQSGGMDALLTAPTEGRVRMKRTTREDP